MKLFFILLLFLIPMSAFADKCIAIMDTVDSSERYEKKLSILQIIDEQRWAELKKNQKINAKFLGFDMDISGSSSYSKFTKEREKIFAKYDFDSDTRHASSYITSTFSDNGKEAYLACLERNSAGDGVYIFPVNITDTKVVVQVKLELPSGVSSTNLELVEITPESLNDKNKIQLILNDLKAKGRTGFTINRDKTRDINIQINSTGGYKATNELLVAAVPKYKPVTTIQPKYEKPIGVTAIAANWRGLALNQLPDSSCGLGGGWARYGWHGRSQIEYCSKVGKGNRYLAEMKAVHGSHINENCAARLGNQWENYAWDGKHKMFLCKRMVSFDVLKLGKESYIESLSHIWPGPCIAPKAQVVDVAGVKFCGIYKTVRPL